MGSGQSRPGCRYSLGAAATTRSRSVARRGTRAGSAAPRFRARFLTRKPTDSIKSRVRRRSALDRLAQSTNFRFVQRDGQAASPRKGGSACQPDCPYARQIQPRHSTMATTAARQVAMVAATPLIRCRCISSTRRASSEAVALTARPVSVAISAAAAAATVIT